jgi:hypothetical protein
VRRHYTYLKRKSQFRETQPIIVDEDLIPRADVSSRNDRSCLAIRRIKAPTELVDDLRLVLAPGLLSQELVLTEHTVSNYLFRIYEKMGISTRVELVLYALRQKQQG